MRRPFYDGPMFSDKFVKCAQFGTSSVVQSRLSSSFPKSPCLQGAAANRERGFVACSAGRWADTAAALLPY